MRSFDIWINIEDFTTSLKAAPTDFSILHLLKQHILRLCGVMQLSQKSLLVDFIKYLTIYYCCNIHLITFTLDVNYSNLA